jgi:uncharacterized damage-inducible protein DinB
MAVSRFPRPGPGDCSAEALTYVAKLPHDNVLEILGHQLDEFADLWRRVGEKRADFRYAPGKWTVKDVACHIVDAERQWIYRAMRFARGDATPLTSWDENTYAAAANASSRRLDSLAAELAYVRRASIVFLEGLDEAAIARRGIADNTELAVSAVPYLLAGHAAHHIEIIRTRYL